MTDGFTPGNEVLIAPIEGDGRVLLPGPGAVETACVHSTLESDHEAQVRFMCIHQAVSTTTCTLIITLTKPAQAIAGHVLLENKFPVQGAGENNPK